MTHTQRQREILEEGRNYLELVTNAYGEEKYDASYELGEFWSSDFRARVDGILDSCETAHEALFAIQENVFYSILPTGEKLRRGVEWHVARFEKDGFSLQDLPSELEESSNVDEAYTIATDGRRLSPEFFRVLQIVLRINSSMPVHPGPRRVVELGAGCGYLARALRLLWRSNSHIIIDIPETLIFSYMFLRLEFPDARHVFITSRDQARNLNVDDQDFVFIPTMYAEDIDYGDVTLFLNTASLGEMVNEVVRYWMNFVQTRLEPRFLFTQNRFLNVYVPGVHDFRLNENVCSLLYDENWEIAYWHLEPPYMLCPYAVRPLARVVDIFASRPADRPSAEDRATRGDAHLAEVQDQDWFDCWFDIVRPREGRHPGIIDNPLGGDLSTSGALFKLWDSIRLRPGKANLETMLKFLTINLNLSDREFEEVPVYEDWLEKLHVDDPDERSERILNWIAKRRAARQVAATNITVLENWPSADIHVGISDDLRDSLPAGNAKARPGRIELVEELLEYNFVRADTKFVAVRKSLGAIDLFTESIGEREIPPYIFVADDIEALRERIEEQVADEPPQEERDVVLIENTEFYNIVSSGSKVLAVHKGLGHIDLFAEKIGEREMVPYVLVESNLSAIHRRIEELLAAKLQ